MMRSSSSCAVWHTRSGKISGLSKGNPASVRGRWGKRAVMSAIASATRCVSSGRTCTAEGPVIRRERTPAAGAGPARFGVLSLPNRRSSGAVADHQRRERASQACTRCRYAGTHRNHAAHPRHEGAPTVSAEITVTVAGSERSVAGQTTAGDLFEGQRDVVVARVNGELRDLFHPIGDGDVVEPVTIDSEDGLAVLRHSTAHVLAQAVQSINPDAKLGIGPPDPRRLLLRLRRRDPVPPRRPQGPREGDAAHHQRGPDLRAPRRHRRRGARGAGARALQVRARRASRAAAPTRPPRALASRSAPVS